MSDTVSTTPASQPGDISMSMSISTRSPSMLPYLPAELLMALISYMSNADLKTLRFLSRRWTYNVLIVDRLFAAMNIFPHRTILKLFVSTFGNSPVRNRIFHLDFYVVKYWEERLDVDGIQTAWRVREGGYVGVYDYDDDEDYEHDDGQLPLIPLLLDLFRTTDGLKRISTSYLSEAVHNVKGTGYYDFVEDDAELLLPCAPHPDCKMKNLYRLSQCLWSASRRPGRCPAQGSELGSRMQYAVPAALWYAASLSSLRLNSMKFRWLGTEETCLLEQWQNHNATSSGREAGLVIDRTSDIKSSKLNEFRVEDLQVCFEGDGPSTLQLSSARLNVVRGVPAIKSLHLALDFRVDCWRLSTKDFEASVSSLEGVQFTHDQPFFPALQDLFLSAVKCRPAELVAFIDFHCPRLQNLTLSGIAFSREPVGGVYCWVRCLKALKRMCGHRIRKLEITNFLCNSAYNTAPNLVQHWHIYDLSEAAKEEKNGTWLKDAMLDWFHDPNMDDAMCPLNVWELDEDGLGFNSSKDDLPSNSNSNDMGSDVLDASWTWRDCLEPSEDMGFGLFD